MEKRVRVESLPRQIENLLIKFRDELLRALKGNIIGIYLFGSVAFPGYTTHSGDIDFYVVTRRALDRQERGKLDALHGSLARKYRFGKRLDGFYIPLRTAGKRTPPSGLPYAANGRLHLHGTDDDWALHCEHFRRGGCTVLYGKNPRSVFPRVSWRQIKRVLDESLHCQKIQSRKYPFYSVLQLCRLVYSYETRRAVVSKVAAAHWALERLPSIWRPLIRSAMRAYTRRESTRDRKRLKNQAPAFFDFASRQIAKAQHLSTTA